MNDSTQGTKTTTQGISVTLRFGIAAVLATAISLLVFLMYSLQVNVYLNPYVFYYFLIPFLTYILGVIINIFLQNKVCNKIDIAQIALSNLINFGLPLIVLTLTNIVTILKSPIESVLPFSFDYTLKTQLSTIFWLFWSILYSQIFTSGFITVC